MKRSIGDSHVKEEQRPRDRKAGEVLGEVADKGYAR